MNGVQKVIKYCAMVFACFLSLAIIGTVLTVILRVTTGIAGVKAITGADKERIALSQQYSPEEIESLGITKLLVDCNAEITVKPGEVLSIEAFEVTDEYEIRLTNGTFGIVQETPNFNIHFVWFEDASVKEKVVVTIPEDMMPEEVRIKSGSGTVSIDTVTAEDVIVDSGSGSVVASGINAKSLFMDTGSGRVSVSDSSVADTKLYTGSGSVFVEESDLGTLRLDSGSGSVRMEQVAAKNAKVDSGSGSVVMEGSLTGTSEFETGSGSLTLRLDGSEEEYLVDAECGSGTFRINGKKKDDGRYGNNVKGEVRIDSGSGSVNVEFNTPEAE